MGHHQLDTLDEQIMRVFLSSKLPELVMYPEQLFTNVFRN